jgi:predicted DNA-binding antitoxin AbrB/MazE fold protein
MGIKGVVKGNSIILQEPLPEPELKEGEQVEVIILPSKRPAHRFRTFQLGVKEEALDRERLYGEDTTPL